MKAILIGLVALIALVVSMPTANAATFEINVDDKEHIDVSEVITYNFTADDPIDWITGNTQWGGNGQTHSPQFAGKDVRVEVDMPQGFTIVFDTPGISASQSFNVFGGPAGDYEVRFINDGLDDLKNVKIVFAAGQN